MANPVVHFEFGVRDIAKAKAFYGPLFGWEFNEHGPAMMVGNIGPHAPGMQKDRATRWPVSAAT